MEWLFDSLDRVLGTPKGAYGSVDDGVTYWRRRVLDVAMAVGLVLGAISVVPGVIRAAAEGNHVLLFADIAVLMLAVFVLLGRGVAFQLRAALLVAAAFGIGLVQVVTSGLHTPGPLWLFAGPVLAAILFDLRIAMGLVALVLATLLGQLGLDHLGMLPPDLAAEVGSPRWVEVATDLVLLATVVSLFMGVLLQGLRSSFERVQRVSSDLAEERRRLLQTNEELEQQVVRRRQAEEERAWLATAMEQAEDGVAILELDGRVRYVNRSFERLFDRDAGELLGARIDEVELLAEPDDVEGILDALSNGGVWVGRLTARRGSATWQAQASFSTLRDQRGRPAHRLAVIRDVSREAELEVQLQQAQKMQAIGTFAGGIAHDFNNLLVPIMGTAELLATELEGEARTQVEDIARSARRGRELVAQILSFSRGGRPRASTVTLAEVVKDTERLLRASLPANIELRFELEDPGPVRVSEAEVQQVLMNLSTNAFHAMRRDGGVLTVTVDRVDGGDVDSQGAVALSPPDPTKEYVRLTVSDTGEGMPEDTLARVFEPFFTTKPAGEGTGLGLAMVHGVATGAGGTLIMRSTRSRGTAVEVLLPRASTPEPEEDEPPSAAAGAGQRVLVVDDEEPVRNVVGRFLDRLGYEPTTATAGDARGILESRKPVDLLITDLSMPDLNGLDLGRLARRARPELPMMLSTGLADQETVTRAREAGFTRVLAKPFDMAELSRAVAGALNGDDPPSSG